MKNTFSLKNSQQCIAVGFIALFVRCSCFFFAGQGPSLNRLVSLPRLTERAYTGVQTSNTVHTKVIEQIFGHHLYCRFIVYLRFFVSHHHRHGTYDSCSPLLLRKLSTMLTVRADRTIFCNATCYVVFTECYI